MIEIYNDDLLTYIENNKEYIKDFLNDMQITICDDVITEQASADIEQAAEDLKSSIRYYDNITKYNKIFVVASLGLWSGIKAAQGYFNNLYDAIFNSGCLEDQNCLFFKTKKSTLTLKAIHHDGANVFKFYKVINGKKYAININDLEVTF